MNSYSLEELARTTNSRLVGDPSHRIYGVADLESASDQEASFLTNPRYHQAMIRSSAGVIVIKDGIERPENRNYLISENPDRAFQELIELYRSHTAPKSHFTGIHPTAIIHPTAQIGADVTILPYVVIDGGAKVGKGSYIGAHVSIGPEVEIGEACVIYPHVTVREGCKLGARVVLQPGCVIGSCGYGFTTDRQGRHTKLNQLGNVVIDDDVEIGANTTIDRSRFKSTMVGCGTKIDNLVQIAHGVIIGKHSLIIAQTGIAGSAMIGNHVVLAGKVAVNGHIKIVDQVVVAACSAVSKSLLKAGRYAGVPVQELGEHNKNQVLLRNIGKFVKDLRDLQNKVHGC